LNPRIIIDGLWRYKKTQNGEFLSLPNSLVKAKGGKDAYAAGRDIIINPSKELGSDYQIDISLEPASRENGKYVSLKVTNNNRGKPIICKATIRKMDQLENAEWARINTDECGALSWHQGGSDNNGFKEVFLNPEFINIARLPDLFGNEMNLFIRREIVFTHLVGRPCKAGKYRILIEVQCKFGDSPKVESWYGYIDSVDIDDSDKRRLYITEMKDVNEWR